MRSAKSLALTLAALAAAPATAAASPWNVQPDGTITALSSSLTFRYVSRSAGFTHSFGLYTTSYGMVGPFIFVYPPNDPPGTTKVVSVTPGTQYIFGLTVTENGMTWFSDGTQQPALADQQLKFWFEPLNQYTTRLHIEDLPNWADLETCYNDNQAGNWQETCDYNDMVIDVTNTPEPATMALLATGLVGLAGAGFVRRRRQS